ncbi:MAG: nicotinate phosphoribosyltransferase [Lachnospiraceae bacterium]|nr:nicotinate phosphoribosyltransferase [Lachnospiraceae bacterium]
MNNTNPMLLIDFYKAVHSDMLPEKIEKSVSYFTPRMSRVRMWDNVVMFGLQAFIRTYLMEYFDEEFFGKNCDEVVGEYDRVLGAALGRDAYRTEKIVKLHKLGHLPIEIKALPEGTRVPMHVPMFEISNTHPDFAWLPQALESLISAEMWHPMISATVGATYREIVDKYYRISVDDTVPRAKALGDFSFRGQECLQSAVKSSAGWCLSFLNTATVPVIPFLEQMYCCDCTKETVALGAVSTEHSVMCSNYAVDGDEITLLRRLLTEIYPDTSFSAVLDSYDYWNIINNVLPQLKEEILAHNGCMLMRGDSGDCVEVVTKTVFRLWDIFGGTVNSKGYKVLDPHVKAIYGDSITIQRCEEIYKILIDNGFACSNVALGVGSFSMQCVEEDNMLKPFTRDTFSSCIKATYCEVDGSPIPIFKDPKDGGFKKSQRGLCRVYRNENGSITFADSYTGETISGQENMLEAVFRDGELIKEQTLAEIRNRLNGGNFVGTFTRY